MYKVNRIICPVYLKKTWRSMTNRWLNLLAKKPKSKFRWYSEFKYNETLEALFNMTQGHCAFCDGGDIGAESRKTIEHFRPKSQYPKLAFKWSNLYPCCDRCQSKKRELFHTQLLAPDSKHYNFDKYFIIDFSNGEIIPLPTLDKKNKYRAQITIDCYGLNAPERKKARLRELRFYRQREKTESHINDFSYRYFLKDAE